MSGVKRNVQLENKGLEQVTNEALCEEGNAGDSKRDNAEDSRAAE